MRSPTSLVHVTVDERRIRDQEMQEKRSVLPQDTPFSPDRAICRKLTPKPTLR
jgi:hypothetical protein